MYIVLILIFSGTCIGKIHFSWKILSNDVILLILLGDESLY